MSIGVEDGLRTLSVRMLGEAMNLPTWRIYEMLRNGEAPPHFRVGKTFRFRVRDVDGWMTEQTNDKKREAR